MKEDIQPTVTETTNFSTKYRKLQNYFQFRSAEYQRTSNHLAKPYLPMKKAINFNQSYMKNRTNENNKQEYHRFRNSTFHSPAQIHPLLYPCYSQLAKQNENEYSRYRDSRALRTKRKFHEKCRDLVYDSNALRFPVPDGQVSWNIPFPDYMPVEYTTEKIQHNPKADPSDPSSIENFNQIDKKIDRRSFTGTYHVDPITHRPQNPMGRTGMTGRGRLYYWGPNHAGDPVVTRWLRDENHNIIHRRKNGHDQLKPVLEFVAIRRRDNKQWALPGGMVDPGERVCQTIKREFQEEAVKDGVEKSCIDQLFSNGQKIYEYYVDDPRNTDNAWMETVAVNFHDETGQLTKNIHLDAGDDAEKAVWCPIDQNLELHSCHKEIIKVVVDQLHAYW